MNIPRDVLNLIADYVNNAEIDDDEIINKHIETKLISKCRQSADDVFKVTFHMSGEWIYLHFYFYICVNQQFYCDHNPQKYLRLVNNNNAGQIILTDDEIQIKFAAFPALRYKSMQEYDKCAVDITFDDMDSLAAKFLLSKNGGDPRRTISRPSAEYLCNNIKPRPLDIERSKYFHDKLQIIRPLSFDCDKSRAKGRIVVMEESDFQCGGIFIDFNLIYEEQYRGRYSYDYGIRDRSDIENTKKILYANPNESIKDVKYENVKYKLPQNDGPIADFCFIPYIADTEISYLIYSVEDLIIDYFCI